MRSKNEFFDLSQYQHLLFASPCDSIIQNISEALISVHDRYQAALLKLKEKQISSPDRAGNIMAPRLINLDKWLSDRNRGAWTIYDPAPETWENWQLGAQIIVGGEPKSWSHLNA